MIRYSLLTLFVIGLSIWALRDWYFSLCGLITMMAVFGNESMPATMLGIPGLNPWNLLLVSICIGWFTSKTSEKLSWDMPGALSALLVCYFLVIGVALMRMTFNMEPIQNLAFAMRIEPITVRELWIDKFLNSIKFVVPALLLYSGCNSRKRFQYALYALAGMYIVLSFLVLKKMPLGLLTDGEQLQRRALRVLGRDLGYYRTNLSVMLAGGFWIIFALKDYMDKKLTVFILGTCGIVLLAMLLTGGRGGYLAWGILAMIFVATRYKKYLLLAPVVVLAIAILLPSVAERMMTGLTDSNSQSTLSPAEEEEQLNALSSGRSEFWPLVVGQIAQRPLVGFGYQGVVVSGITLEFYKVHFFPYTHPHNAYLQLLVDNGIIGSLPILIFFFLILKYSWQMYRHPHDKICNLAGAASFSLVMAFIIGAISGQSFYPEERSFGMWCAIMLMLKARTEMMKVATPEATRKQKRRRSFKSGEDEGPKNNIWEEEPDAQSVTARAPTATVAGSGWIR